MPTLTSNHGAVSYLELPTILSGQEPLLRVRDGMKQGGPSVLQAPQRHARELEQGFLSFRGIRFSFFLSFLLSNFSLILPLSNMVFLLLFSTHSSLSIISLPTCYVFGCKKTLDLQAKQVISWNHYDFFSLMMACLPEISLRLTSQ